MRTHGAATPGGRRGAIAQGTMWPDRVVVLPPPFEKHLGLEQRVKRFPLEQLVSKQYKRSSRCNHSPYGEQWLDEQSFQTNTTQPFTDALGRELSRESLRM